MPALTLDGRKVEFAPGATLMDVAKAQGIDIPNLCYLEKCGPLTSCLACVMKVNGQDRYVPSCATAAQDGMIVESETEEVHVARRTALELLFSDHLGDCLSPCERICPMRLAIPAMLREIQANNMDEAIGLIREQIALPSVLARLCHRPCEKGCRRGDIDNPAAICDLERHVADADLAREEPFFPKLKPATGKRIAIIGSGPVGLTAAYHLLLAGHQCSVLDRNDSAGGTLRTEPDPAVLPPEILTKEIELLKKHGLAFELKKELKTAEDLTAIRAKHDAVLICCGAISKSAAEALGLIAIPAGVKVDAVGQTHLPGVFAAGAAVKPVKQIVRAMSEGLNLAHSVNAWLEMGAAEPLGKEFSCMMGRLEETEVHKFVQMANPSDRINPCQGCAIGFIRAEAMQEASRCMHCDCRSSGNCKLEFYSDLYGVDPNRYPRERRPFEVYLEHPQVIFEPGKCIACGICVRLAELAGEEVGLAYVGRGFDMRIGPALHQKITEALKVCALECAEGCPTGAIAKR